MSKASIELIGALSNAGGVSGFEDEVIAIARERASDVVEITEDRLRNLYLYRKENSGSRPVVLLDAHSDEIGLMVQSVNRNGTMNFVTVGGWVPEALVAQQFRIRNRYGEDIPAVVTSIPPHFTSTDREKSQLCIQDLFLDVGARSAEETKAVFGIQPGAPVVPDVRFYYHPQRDIMIGKALDCRIGCAALIETLEAVGQMELDIDVVGTLSSQEELGLRGIQVAARTVNPDVAIVFEGTPGDDTIRDSDTAQAAIKKGPQIRHMDSSMMANPRFVAFTRDIAEKANIPFQDAVRIKGGTNGGVVTLTESGIPTVVLGVPVRHTHTHHGISSLSDYSYTVAWGIELLKALGEKVIRGF